MRPEGPKIEAEGRERGWCSWGGDSKTPPHQLVDLGSTASSPSRVIVLLVMLYDVFF